jgi:uncharacterized coiled-coil protein SlyX
MARTIGVLPQMAIFFAGVAAGALTTGVKRQGCACAPATKDLQTGLAILESKLAAQESAHAERFKRMETRLEQHAARLADVPSTNQIVEAMEELLSKTMTSLDNRLTAQAKSIDTLRSTVSQTDSLLGKVLESLDSLQIPTDPSEPADDPMFNRRLS